MDDRPATTTIKIYEFDPKRERVPGKNPLPLTTASMPYEPRYPRRERAAKEVVTRLLHREPTISHAIDGSVVAVVYVKSTQ